MSKYLEYAKLAFRGIKDIDKIAESVLTQVKLSHGNLPEDEQEEIAKRKLICHSCPFYSLNLKTSDEEYVKLYNEKFQFNGRDDEKFCGICGCPEKTKVSSLSSNCGLEYYNEKHPNIKQKLKWKSYTKTNK